MTVVEMVVASLRDANLGILFSVSEKMTDGFSPSAHIAMGGIVFLSAIIDIAPSPPSSSPSSFYSYSSSSSHSINPLRAWLHTAYVLNLLNFGYLAFPVF